MTIEEKREQIRTQDVTEFDILRRRLQNLLPPQQLGLNRNTKISILLV
jgi:hypothetical protein